MEEQLQRIRSREGGRLPRTTTNLEDPKSLMLPVWFFVRLILLCYGLIILAAGFYEFAHPPATVLADLHPALWRGAILAVIGGIYTYTYAPKKP